MVKATTQTRVRNASLNIRISEKERRAFKKAAKAADCDLSTWIRMNLRSLAGMKSIG